jgi:negative regulator of sigma E activity
MINRNRSRVLTLFFGGVFLLGLIAAGAVPQAAAEEVQDAKAILTKMALGIKKTRYEGRKVVIDFSKQVPDITHYQVIHALPDEERRDYPDLGRVLITKDGWLWQYFPREGVVIKRKAPVPEEWDMLQQENLDLVMKSYLVRLSHGMPLLGRQSLLVQMDPLDQGSRPMRKIWIDGEKGLPLRGEVYGVDGNLYILSHFELINYQAPANAEAFRIKVPPGRVIEHGAGTEECSYSGKGVTPAIAALWRPAVLPPGFILKGMRRTATGGGPRFQQLYTDGLSALSLFQEHGERSPHESAGKVSAVMVGPSSGLVYDLGLMRLVKWNREGQHFVLVGELSTDSMIKVATSVAFTPDKRIK